VLAFPCNQFGGQEPGTDAEVCAFVRNKGGAYPVMSKVDVNGDAAHPLFQKLKGTDSDGEITWNFSACPLPPPHLVPPATPLEVKKTGSEKKSRERLASSL